MTTDDFCFKAAHIAIRSVADKATLSRVSSRILNNELIYVEDTGMLYIKSNNAIKPISGGTTGDEDFGGGETGMTQEELKQWLLSNDYITADDKLNSYKLSPIADLKLIHEGSGKSFNIEIDSEGNISGTEIVNITQDGGNNSETFVSRGVVAHYNIGSDY
jgi:hypothetical protein